MDDNRRPLMDSHGEPIYYNISDVDSNNSDYDDVPLAQLRFIPAADEVSQEQHNNEITSKEYMYIKEEEKPIPGQDSTSERGGDESGEYCGKSPDIDKSRKDVATTNLGGSTTINDSMGVTMYTSNTKEQESTLMSMRLINQEESLSDKESMGDEHQGSTNGPKPVPESAVRKHPR